MLNGTHVEKLQFCTETVKNINCRTQLTSLYTLDLFITKIYKYISDLWRSYTMAWWVVVSD